jgi:phosphoglycerate kinase
MSHLGRPKPKDLETDFYEEKFSLKHIVNHLSNLIGSPVTFIENCIGEKTTIATQQLKSGEVLLLENLRFHKHETKGNEEFAKSLSTLGDVYVNDAFGTAHRSHASTVVIAQYFTDKVFGYVMANELSSINMVLTKADKPFTAIMGGAKVSGKILIIEALLDKIDNLIIGGGMSYTFIKAQGGNIGDSLVEDDKLSIALKILSEAKEKGVNIYIPIDTIAAESFNNEANKVTVDIDKIPDGYMGLDIGPKSEVIVTEVISNSKTILWNGPMGVFEMSNFESGTKATAEAIVEATSKGAYSLIGGGDSVAAINKYNMANKVSYVSTGGGALLEYIESGDLPGVSAIEK